MAMRDERLRQPSEWTGAEGTVVAIVLEPNRMTHKGGSRKQVSAHLSSDSRKFRWRPRVEDLERMLWLAFSPYGWDGATGLYSEIFKKV